MPPEERIATFDQDGTLWVEQPIYTQVIYCLDRVPAVVKEKPALADVEPFKTVLSGNREAIGKIVVGRLREDRGCHAHRHERRGFRGRSERLAGARRRTRAGSGLIPI